MVAMPMLIICPVNLMVPIVAEATPRYFFSTALITEFVFRRRKNQKPDSKNNQADDDISVAVGITKECQHNKSDYNDSHAQGGQDTGIILVGKPPGKCCHQHHDRRLCDQDGACFQRLHPFAVLKVKAQHKGNGKGGCIVDEGGKVGKSKDAVVFRKAEYSAPDKSSAVPPGRILPVPAKPEDVKMKA